MQLGSCVAVALAQADSCSSDQTASLATSICHECSPKSKQIQIQKPKPKLESPVKTFEDVYGKQDKKETKEQITSKTSKIPEHNSALNIDDNVKKNIEKVLNKSGTPENKAYKERLKEYKNWNTGKYSDEQLKKMAKADASEETASYIQYLQDCGLSAQKIHEKYGYSIDTIRSAMSWQYNFKME